MRRVSEDRSNVRGHGMYGSEYRSHNRGFWRGQPKAFQGQLPPPVRRPNIFFEAGRLATEYLVSNGVLPRNVLLGKWQNGNIKDYMGEFHGFSRLQEGDSLHLPSDSRASALSRLGDPISDLVISKKRTGDEFIPDSRIDMRGKKRMGSFNNYSSDSSRENGKNIGTILEKRKISPERDAGNSSSFKYQENLKVGVDKDGLKTNSLSIEVGTSSEMNEQSFKEDESFKPSATTTVASVKEEKDFSLLSLCRFAKVPTKARSKFRKSSVSNEDKNCNTESHVDSRIVAIASNGSSNVMFSNQIQGSESLNSDILKEPTVAAAKTDTLIIMDDDEEKQTECSHSPERNLESQNDNPSESANCSSSSTAMEKDEKRVGEHVNSWNGTSIITHDNLCIHIDEARSVDVPLFPKDSVGPCITYGEENQLFPASFRTCDLNLMEASEATDGFDQNPLLVFQSPSETNKAPAPAPAPMDIDLCINNNCNISDKYSRRTADGKMVEVIDLEPDSGEENKSFDHSDIKAAEAVFTGLEDFPSHSKNTNDISDNHDGFGLILSEFLRTDITSSSSVPQNISLHNEMGLHDGEGILDEDSIYMSLGEIPIRFSPVWEQPTQDYDKPF
ncbi:uncharacterized protein At4g26450 [Impatiens glandulifera]|uniref:uncharacterized protein At4g26450 n=1 Tax=Impatiens glandulifera TaxID=253017 RepID=UPI001FB12EFE|nr:uncharacterized protein At4g26450 [Impatiens glandulifera]